MTEENIRTYWWPVRFGLILRKYLRIFARSYGTTRIRRALAVFIGTLLDEDHQETYSKNIHAHFLRTYAKEGEKYER